MAVGPWLRLGPWSGLDAVRPLHARPFACVEAESRAVSGSRWWPRRWRDAARPSVGNSKRPWASPELATEPIPSGVDAIVAAFRWHPACQGLGRPTRELCRAA